MVPIQSAKYEKPHSGTSIFQIERRRAGLRRTNPGARSGGGILWEDWSPDWDFERRTFRSRRCGPTDQIPDVVRFVVSTATPSASALAGGRSTNLAEVPRRPRGRWPPITVTFRHAGTARRWPVLRQRTVLGRASARQIHRPPHPHPRGERRAGHKLWPQEKRAWKRCAAVMGTGEA